MSKGLKKGRSFSRRVYPSEASMIRTVAIYGTRKLIGLWETDLLAAE
ncbi:MAG: hypothetical protein ABSD38_04280 [Syntrophorhabdales bacterium]|jgi:hypothetical protein